LYPWVALYVLSNALPRITGYAERVAEWLRGVLVCIAVVWLSLYLMHELTALLARAKLANYVNRGTLGRVVWFAPKLGSADALLVAKTVPFGPLVVPHSVWANTQQFITLGSALILVALAIGAARVAGADVHTGVVCALVLIVGAHLASPILFPNRLRIAPGILQVIKANRLTRRVRVRTVPLKDARIVLWASAPTMITLDWWVAQRAERLTLRRVCEEVCKYILIGAISDLETPELPSPKVGEPLRGPWLGDPGGSDGRFVG
jgi:hypothetical protein